MNIIGMIVILKNNHYLCNMKHNDELFEILMELKGIRSALRVILFILGGLFGFVIMSIIKG